MKALIETSGEYRGQLRVTSDNPYLLAGFEDDMFAPDGHITNQDRAFEAAKRLNGFVDVGITKGAENRLQRLTDASQPTSSLFTGDITLKGFQCRAVNNMRDERNIMLNCSCGTGKTLMSIFMACQRIEAGEADKVVVWCSPSLISDWVDAIRRFTDFTVSTVNRQAVYAKREAYYREDDAVFTVLNYERMRIKDRVPIEASLKGKHPLFIFDEVTKLKGRGSTQHKEMAKLTRHLDMGGMLGLSATPIQRAPEDYYNEWRILEPSIFGRVMDFEHRFTVNDGEKYFYNYVGYRNLEQMHLMTGAQVFSASKGQPEIAREFPSFNEIPIRCELGAAAQRVYDEIMAYGETLDPLDPECGRQNTLFSKTLIQLCVMPEVLLLPHKMAGGIYGEQQEHIDGIVHRHEKALEGSTNCNKLDVVQDKVEEILDSGEKVIIFGEHTNNCLFPLARHLERFHPLLYTGETGDKEREAVKDAFKHTDAGLLLMSDAGKEGLNLQECRNVIHYELPFLQSSYTQRSERIHRIDSQFDSVDVYRIVTGGTIEDRIEEIREGRKATSIKMGFEGEYSEYGANSDADLGYICGF